MLILDSTSDKLQVVTSAAVTVDVHASTVNWDGTTATPASAPTAITTAATTDVVAAPIAANQITVKTLNIRNKHASSSNTITVQHVTGAGTFELFKCTLLAGEELVSREGVWFHYDVNGGVYTAASQGVDPRTNDFRLTGVTLTPVMTADSTALATVYLTPYKGAQIALYDGTNWQLISSAEVSLAVTGRTIDLPFDVFGYSVAGVVTLEFLNWTSATARATGLTRQDGVWTKTGDATRRFLGSIRARSATTFHWVLSGTDAPCKFDLSNADNRVDFAWMLKALSPATWAYTTATIRQAQASANYQVDVMVGLQEEILTADLLVNSTNSTISIGRAVGVGYDSTTAFTGENSGTINTVASIQSSLSAQLAHQPGIGRHFYSWNETSVATGACTFTGSGVVAGFNQQSGMRGTWTC